MEHWIHQVAEPARLILAWQAPDQFGPENRTRWAVGIIERAAGVFTFRYFGHDEFALLNQGRSFDDLKKFGYRGYPTFRPAENTQRHDTGVLEAFTRRLPPRSRPDFAEYLRLYRVPATAHVSDFALLGITEGKLPSDGFSLVDPLDAQLQRCDLMLEVAGYRHYARALHARPFVGQEAAIVEDPDKTYEPHAVAVFVDGEKVGNINRLQAPTFIEWLDRRRVVAVVERLNGAVDKPRMHIFIQVRPSPMEHPASPWPPSSAP